MNNETLVELASDIVCAHVAHNNVAMDDVPALIQSVYTALAGASAPAAAPEVEHREPAVSIRSSVKADSLVCLDCGVKLKSLKRHLGTSHGLTPDGYRARWDLPRTYPMVSSDYSEVRRQAAMKNELGRKPGQRKSTVDSPIAGKPPRKKLKLSL